MRGEESVCISRNKTSRKSTCQPVAGEEVESRRVESRSLNKLTCFGISKLGVLNSSFEKTLVKLSP